MFVMTFQVNLGELHLETIQSGLHSTTNILFSVSTEANMPINFIKGIASSHTILLQRKSQRITKSPTPVPSDSEITCQNAIVPISSSRAKEGKPVEDPSGNNKSEK